MVEAPRLGPALPEPKVELAAVEPALARPAGSGRMELAAVRPDAVVQGPQAEREVIHQAGTASVQRAEAAGNPGARRPGTCGLTRETPPLPRR